MTAGEWIRFVRQQGLTGGEIGALVLGLLLLGLQVTDLLSAGRKSGHRLTLGDQIRRAVRTTANVGVMAACFFLVWYLPRERYLLRPGAGRYTVGTVAEHYWQRGRHRFVLAYRVAGTPCQITGACGIKDGQEMPCPALGSRYYIYFSPADLNTAQNTAIYVPDSVRAIPPLGWARLP